MCETEFNNYHPDYLGEPYNSSKWQKVTLKDCRNAIAYEYGYNSWKEIETEAKIPYNHKFQDAIDQILQGKIDKLIETIHTHPDILSKKSQYGHHAMLIHYCGSNGLEMWRQQVPLNLVEIVKLLISQGIDVKAPLLIYGRWHTTAELVATSIHPQKAGILEALLLSLF